MTPKQMVSLLRKVINDEQGTGFSEGGNLEEPEGTQELMHYLDRAVNEYSQRQAASGDMRLVKRLVVTTNTPIPEDFLKFCGRVPVSVMDNKLTYYGESGGLSIKYFARLPYVTAYGDEDDLPYSHEAEMFIISLAAIYALNKHEYDVSQHLLLLGYGGVGNVAGQ